MTEKEFYIKAIFALVPNAEFAGDLESGIIHWGSKESQPSEENIKTKLKELQDEYDAKKYQRDRAVEYPSIEDQLDEIFHKGLTEWKKTIQAVKDKHPKSTE